MLFRQTKRDVELFNIGHELANTNNTIKIGKRKREKIDFYKGNLRTKSLNTCPSF